LISEELKELAEAIQNNDIVEVADALCDIQYVLSMISLGTLPVSKVPKANTIYRNSNPYLWYLCPH
jgi:hypothetical protein